MNKRKALELYTSATQSEKDKLKKKHKSKTAKSRAAERAHASDSTELSEDSDSDLEHYVVESPSESQQKSRKKRSFEYTKSEFLTTVEHTNKEKKLPGRMALLRYMQLFVTTFSNRIFYFCHK